MRVKSNLISLMCFVLFFSMPVLAETNLSVKELKEQYNLYDKIANDPDIIWFITLDVREIAPVFNIVPDIDIARGKFIHRAKLEKMVMEKLLFEGKGTLQDMIDFMADHIRASEVAKNELRKKLLPDLKKEIKKRENSANPHMNLNYNTYHRPNNTPSKEEQFDNFLNKVTSDEHMNALNFDNILAASNGTSGTGTAIQNTQIGSFDGNWSDAISDNYSSCPKTKPDDRLSFRAYPNGETSGNTYRNCVYFNNGYLKREEPYINGKLDGLKTSYSWSKEYNSSYASTRENYSNGERNGLYETYSMSKTGAVYRSYFVTYSNGMKHGDSAMWYENGQTKAETKYLQDKPDLQYNYNKDGKFTYCTKWDHEGYPMDCKTMKRR